MKAPLLHSKASSGLRYGLLLLATLVALAGQHASSARADPASNLTQIAGPLVIDGTDGQVVENASITSKEGPCVTIKNAKNITIRNSQIGPCGGHGIEIVDSSSIQVLDSYVHPEFPVKGCCDKANGIFARLSNTILIQGNIVAYGESNVQLLGVHDVQVVGNFLLNPLGPAPRGTQIQAWALGTTRSSNIIIDSNYALASRDPKFKFPEGQTDAINLGYTDNAIVHYNYITGGQYHSGCGLIADDSANRMQFLDNIVLDTAGCGIGIASGTNQVVDGNKIFIHGIAAPNSGNIAMYVWKQGKASCGPVVISNNVVAGFKPSGTLASWWTGGGCGDTTLTANTLDQAAIDALSAVVSGFLTPLVIPPVAYESKAPSPFSSLD